MNASDPPLRIEQFPDLKQRAETSAVTVQVMKALATELVDGTITHAERFERRDMIMKEHGLMHVAMVKTKAQKKKMEEDAVAVLEAVPASTEDGNKVTYSQNDLGRYGTSLL